MQDVRRAADADVAVISAPKSGRTWLRVMLSKIWQDRFDIPSSLLIDNDNYRRLNQAAPAVFFTHGFGRSNSIVVDPAATVATLRNIRRQVFMFRDPRDVAVSAYFHITRRRGLAEDAMEAAFWGRDRGLPAQVAFLNTMVEVSAELPHLLPLRYESVIDDPGGELRRVVDHFEMSASDDEIASAVTYGSFANMAKLESESAFDGHFLGVRDPTDRDSFKVRRGKVGGYLDYFPTEVLVEIDQYVADNLDPSYGYGQRESLPDNVPSAPA